MNHYMILVLLIIFTAFLMKGNRAHNKAYVIVASLLLFSIYGLRNTYVIGNDSTSSYLHTFQRIGPMTWGEVAEIGDGTNTGYFLLNKLFFELSGGDYQLFVTTISAFVTICFGRLIYRYSPSPVQSILYHFGLLFFTFHFSALKQSIAMAFLMLAFDCVMEQKLFRFLLTVILASFFHFPALVFLPAYWFAKLHPGRSYLFLFAIVLLLTYLFRNQIINLMLSLYKDDGTTADLSSVQFLRTKALIMIVIVVAALVFRKPVQQDRQYDTLLIFMGIAVVFQTFCGYNNIFERLADYYFQFSVIFIPMVFDRTADRQPLIGWRLMDVIDFAAPYMFCGYSVYRFITTCTSDSMLYPFKFFFEV